jgi:ligand-binding sensor domain-containing protein
MVQYDEQRNLIGTDAGVLWFDGKVFFPFDNKNPFIGFQINCISKLVDGSVLIGVKDALWLYKKDRNSFKAPVPLLKNLSIYNILIDDEKLWIATSKGVYYFNDSKSLQGDPSEIYLPGQPAVSVAKGRNNEIWISSNKIYKKKLPEARPEECLHL